MVITITDLEINVTVSAEQGKHVSLNSPFNPLPVLQLCSYSLSWSSLSFFTQQEPLKIFEILENPYWTIIKRKNVPSSWWSIYKNILSRWWSMEEWPFTLVNGNILLTLVVHAEETPLIYVNFPYTCFALVPACQYRLLFMLLVLISITYSLLCECSLPVTQHFTTFQRRRLHNSQTTLITIKGFST